MDKPRILDLFCAAGGASMGYSLAGYDVTGVDIKDQPRYPFTFHKADALDYLSKHGHEYDVITASPPCQVFSRTKHIHDSGHRHADLLDATRQALQSLGKPYIIENVQEAPMQFSIMLCGLMFGLKVIRHRRFESSHILFTPVHPKHNGSQGKTALRGGVRPGRTRPHHRGWTQLLPCYGWQGNGHRVDDRT